MIKPQTNSSVEAISTPSEAPQSGQNSSTLMNGHARSRAGTYAPAQEATTRQDCLELPSLPISELIVSPIRVSFNGVILKIEGLESGRLYATCPLQFDTQTIGHHKDPSFLGLIATERSVDLRLYTEGGNIIYGEFRGEDHLIVKFEACFDRCTLSFEPSIGFEAVPEESRNGKSNRILQRRGY